MRNALVRGCHGTLRLPGVPRGALMALAVLVPACERPGPVDDPAGSGDAGALIADWLHAWNTRDLTAVERLFLPDSTVTYFSSEWEGPIRGPAEVRRHHVRMGFALEPSRPGQELWVEQLESRPYGATIVATAMWYFGDRTAPRDSVQRGPMTAVFVRDHGELRIAHMHFGEY